MTNTTIFVVPFIGLCVICAYEIRILHSRSVIKSHYAGIVSGIVYNKVHYDKHVCKKHVCPILHSFEKEQRNEEYTVFIDNIGKRNYWSIDKESYNNIKHGEWFDYSQYSKDRC